MKKTIYIIGIILLFIYICIIKFYIPVSFISYENYHGIEFLNNIFLNNYDIINYFKVLFSIGGMDDGHTNRIFYGFLISKFGLNTDSIFYVQSFFSILSYCFFSASLYVLSNKNRYLAFIFFILLLVSPHQIKYGFSEDYYILGNFFISISIFTFNFFLTKEKLVYFILSLLFFLLSIYSRTLYLLYIPIFIICFLLIKNISFLSIRLYFNNHFYKLLLIILGFFLLLFPIIDRYKILNSQSGKYLGITENDLLTILLSQNNLLGIINNTVFNIYYDILIYVGLIGTLIYFIRNKFYIKSFSFILLFIYLNFLFYKYLNTDIGYGLALERHILLLEVIYILFISLGIYSIYYLIIKYLNNIYKNILYLILLLPLLYIPFFAKDYILEKYSYQKEFIFLNNNISNIGNNFNLIIPNSSVNDIEYAFPIYLFKNINHFNIQLYNIVLEDSNDYSSFIENYNNIKDKNNIFYLSTACYSYGNDVGTFGTKEQMRKDCKYIFDNYNLETIIEKRILSNSYILPRINAYGEEITIGFYKIKGLKDD